MNTKHELWKTTGLLGICLVLAACASKPPGSVAVSAPLPAVNPTCALTPTTDGDLGMSCLLTDWLLDTQVDAEQPGSTACGGRSFSLFRQTMSTPIWLVHGQKGDDGPLRVRVGGKLGPGTHAGMVGKSAGNHCDALVGPVANLQTRYGGSYVAVVDKTQRPVCVSQSRLALSTFTQTQSAALSKDLGGVLRESTSDALQKRLDLEVATQINRRLQPGAALPEALASRHGRCSEGFRTFIGD